MTKPIRLGLIGCGGIVQLVHAHAYLSLPDAVKVVALAGVVEENLQQVGQTFDVPPEQRYTDHRDMLAKAEIDAVTVATPHFLHAEHAIEAASAGAAVISEKPMVTTFLESAKVDEASRDQIAYQNAVTLIQRFCPDWELPSEKLSPPQIYTEAELWTAENDRLRLVDAS